MAKFTLIFNQPVYLTLPIVLAAGLLGLDVLVIDNKAIRKRAGWLWGLNKGLYRAHAMVALKPVHSMAIEQSQALVSVTPQVRALTGCAGDDADALVVRLLAERLLDYHAVEAQLVPKLVEQGRVPIVCSSDHAVVRRLLERHDLAQGGATLLLGPVLRFAAWVKMVISTLGFSFVVAGALVWQKALARCYRPTEPAKEYSCAVSLPFGFFTKFKGPRAYDFLVDGCNIRKNDVVFIDEFGANSGFIMEESKNGGNFIRFRQSFVRTIFMHSISLSCVAYCFRLLPILVSAGCLVGTVRMAAKLILVQAILWESFLSRCRFRHLVYAMSDSVAQNAANFVLRRHGVTTWYYNAAIGSPYLYEKEGTSQDCRHVLWEGRILDWLVVNSQAFADSQALHGQRVKHYAVIGNIFSEMIASVSIKEAEARLGVDRGDHSAVLACFDTSYMDDECCPTTFHDGLGFYEDLLRFSQCRPDHLLLIKPSKDDRYFVDTSGLWASTRMGAKIVDARKSLRQQRNVRFLADDADPSDVIALADITITNGFSSPTADALAAGRRAFWYDAVGSHHDYCLDDAGLTRHGYEEMIEEVDRLLALSNEEFAAQIGSSSQARYLLDPYMDQKALTRFREMLADS